MSRFVLLRLVVLRIAPLFAVAFLVACGTSEKSQQQQTVEEVYTSAMANYNDGDWNAAISQFDIIKLQYPASQFADDAQYMLAEINFKRSEYIIAAFNYSMVRRSYPTSDLAKPAMYKAALCYNEIAGPPDRDQEYTRKAIQAFSEFQSVYPVDSLALECVVHIHELRSRLAERYMIVAEHYVTTRSLKSALIYYDAVMDEYPDSKWYEMAVVEKVRTQLAMKKIEEARATVTVYRRTVKDPKLASQMDALEKEIP